MIPRRSKSIWLVATLALVLALGVARPLGVEAQTPQLTNASCQLPSPPSATQIQQLQAQLQQSQTQFAQALAQALNLPLATVQQALTTQAAAIPPPALPSPPPDLIAAAAKQLGVSEDQLAAAVQAADAALPCPQVPNPPTIGAGSAGGPTFFIGVNVGASGGTTGNGTLVSNAGGSSDSTTFFNAVAQSLGQGLTADQVESAFVSTAPAFPDPTQLQAMLQGRVSDLATALGVSVDALTTALQSMAAAGACLPPGVLGGDITFKAGNAPATPPIGGSGLFYIPLPKPVTGSGVPAPPDLFGLKPCGGALLRGGSPNAV